MKKPISIASARNPLFKQLLSLKTGEGIKKQNKFVISGAKFVTEAMNTRPEWIRFVVISEAIAGGQECGRQPKATGSRHQTTSPVTGFSSLASSMLALVQEFPLVHLANSLFRELDWFGTNHPLAVCEVPAIPDWNPHQDDCGLEVLLSQGDPGNLGAAIRSAVAFGTDRIVLLQESAHPFHPKVVRASAGTCLQGKFAQGPRLTELNCSHLVMLDLAGEDLPRFSWPKNCRLLVGEEGPGLAALKTLKNRGALPQAIAQARRVRIPIDSSVESLNATVALSIALYSRRAQLK